MTVRTTQKIRPLAANGKRAIVAILATFVLFSATSVGLSIRAVERSQHQAAVLQVAARQRMLADRYVQEVLLARDGIRSDPGTLASMLTESAHALLDGGTAPAVDGDDDERILAPAKGSVIRDQLAQATRLVNDLTATGSALLARRPVASVPQTGGEVVTTTDPVQRLRVLAALTSNVSLNAAASIAARTDRNVNDLIALQVGLGVAGVFVSLLVGWALVAATRRQTAHFRALVTSSTDLVLVFGEGGCRYASESVASLLNANNADLLGPGFMNYVDADDRRHVESACSTGEPYELRFVVSAKFGESRHLEAHVSDLRNDRHVHGVVINARDITERVRLEDELTHQAFHDGLTGLPNRALLRDRLEHALARSSRSAATVAVLFCDLDSFKAINDTLGHDAGDVLLVEVARRFERNLRDADTAARLGGDEFAIVLDESDVGGPAMLAQRLLDALRDPVLIDGREIFVRASIGIADNADEVLDADELLCRADIAMYAAKSRGRDRFEVFQSTMQTELSTRHELHGDLRHAVLNGELFLNYQPLLDLDTQSIESFEALVRWNHPTRGLVGPDEFIPLAEETGLIIEIGRYVLHEACRQTQEWRTRPGAGDLSIGVNVSAKQLYEDDFVANVESVLRETGLPATSLILELTESTLLSDTALLQARLVALKQSGIRIAIDDFGTGYSSLAYLRNFPVDYLKIDRSFVNELGEELNDQGRVMVRSIIDIGHNLDLGVVAEGIEQHVQLDELRAAGCNTGQGYLFAKPVPAAEVPELLSRYAQPAPERT